MTEEQLEQSISKKCQEAEDLEKFRKPTEVSLIRRCAEPGCKAFLPKLGLTIEEQDLLSERGWICFTIWSRLRVNTATFSVQIRCPKHSNLRWKL